MATKLKDIGTVQDALDELDTRPTVSDAALSADLVAAFAEIEGAAKDKVNPAFKSKYADIASVIDAIKPVLARHNLAFYQRPQPSDDGVLVQTLLRHASGGEVDLGTLYVPANKKDPQGFGSALTYARRYALMTAFGVPAEDDDGNAAASSSRANPSKGAARPNNSADDRLPEDLGRGEGEMSSSALRASLRLLVHHINGCASVADLDDVLDTEDAKEVIDNCQRRFPAWWETGENMPAEFVPLKKLIEQTRAGLATLENAE